MILLMCIKQNACRRYKYKEIIFPVCFWFLFTYKTIHSVIKYVAFISLFEEIYPENKWILLVLIIYLRIWFHYLTNRRIRLQMHYGRWNLSLLKCFSLEETKKLLWKFWIFHNLRKSNNIYNIKLIYYPQFLHE